MKKTLVLLAVICFTFSTYAAVKLPTIWGSGMVLQRNKPITVWGWAAAGERIRVHFHNQTKQTRTDKTGHWKLTLNAETAGGPYNLTVKGTNTITLSDVLVGDVWICSGQSNMELPVHKVMNADQEITQANFPKIRHFAVNKSIAFHPQEDLEGGGWETCDSTTVANFTAVGYFFGRTLYQALNIPIGLIHTSWGGTNVETWTGREAFEQSPEFKEMIAHMPVLDIDAVIKKRKDQLLKTLQKFNINLPAKQVDQWQNPGYEDSSWPTMNIPGVWEGQGLEQFDGVVWFRKTFTIAPQDAGKEAVIELAKIDDEDKTYINGTLIGQTYQWETPRRYKIPAGVLKADKNTIAIRVQDAYGNGGIYGDPNNMRVITTDAVIPLAGKWRFNVSELLITQGAIEPNDYPTLLFNAMINPLLQFSITGAIWYQGEANADRAYQYRTAFPLMIQDWRNHWQQGNFPFYFVQLANFNANNSDSGTTWAELREAQTMALQLPNTGMAVTIDIGNGNDIHPRNKQEVGKRLAAIALHNVYKQENEYSGPMYKNIVIEGHKIRIAFNHTGTGLMAKDKYGYIKGFEISGADQKFHYAKAWIDGDYVVVASDNVKNPVAARYAWADNPEDANLYNKEGFPASPFRTDEWEAKTANIKYSFQK